jgi:antitoxin CptB
MFVALVAMGTKLQQLFFLCGSSVSSVVKDLVEQRQLERLKWRSRRGLLELDIVFERFWLGEGAKLDESQAAALEKLLALPDNDLLDLVMGKASAPGDLGDMVEKLRAA